MSFDAEHLDFKVHGKVSSDEVVAPITSEHFTIISKRLDARPSDRLGATAQEVYSGVDLGFNLWTVWEKWGVLELPTPPSLSSDAQTEEEEAPATTIAIATPKKEWLQRRDYVEILGFTAEAFGNVTWVEISEPEDITDADVLSVYSSRVGFEPVDGLTRFDPLMGPAYRRIYDDLWTTRIRDTAKAHVRTIYVANRLSLLGVSFSDKSEVIFHPGYLGVMFRSVGEESSDLRTANVEKSVIFAGNAFRNFAKQSAFIEAALHEWKALGLDVPMVPFPFGVDSDERRAFANPAPTWYVPVMTFGFQESQRQASMVQGRTETEAQRMYGQA